MCEGRKPFVKEYRHTDRFATPRQIASREVGALLQLCPGSLDGASLEFYRHCEAGILGGIEEKENVITLFLVTLSTRKHGIHINDDPLGGNPGQVCATALSGEDVLIDDQRCRPDSCCDVFENVIHRLLDFRALRSRVGSGGLLTGYRAFQRSPRSRGVLRR